MTFIQYGILLLMVFIVFYGVFSLFRKVPRYKNRNNELPECFDLVSEISDFDWDTSDCE